jgi:DNA-binding ferritin-like protein
MDPLHATHAIWIDPLSYNYLKDGPPYLPGLVGGKVASESKATMRAWVRQAAVGMGQDILVAFQHCVAEYANAPMAELAVLLACVRAEAMIHQAHHWQTRGQSYYGDHLLFERLYGEVNGFIDGLAERSIGSGQEVLVQPLMQMSHMVAFSKLFYSDAPVVPAPEEMPLLSLRALLKSALVLQMAYGSLQAKGLLSNGIDNLLQGIADKQESLMYLLKQRTKTREANMFPKTALEAFQHELMTRRVASRFVEAMEHATPEALGKYLKDHPNADKSKHTVKKKDEGGKSKSESGSKPSKKRHSDVKDVMTKHDLKDEDADELEKFKKRKPSKGTPLTDQQLMQKFLREASPETKERMKGMSVGDFKKMYAAIMDEEGGEG